MIIKKTLCRCIVMGFLAQMLPLHSVAADEKSASSPSASMTLKALKIPDITILTDLYDSNVKIDEMDAVSHINAMLKTQYAVNDKDLKPSNDLSKVMHAKIATFIENGNIIAAYGLANELKKLPTLSKDKLINLDVAFIETAISPSGDIAETKLALDKAQVAINRIGVQNRRDWHTYIYWAIVGHCFSDKLAEKAGLIGLQKTGAKSILIATKKELTFLKNHPIQASAEHKEH